MELALKNSPFLGGPKGWDYRVRILALRYMEEVDPKGYADPIQRRQWLQNFNDYNPLGWSALERFMKVKSGLQPFATASMGAMKREVQQMSPFSRPDLPPGLRGSAGQRVMNSLVAWTGGPALVWMAAFYATKGRWPQPGKDQYGLIDLPGGGALDVPQLLGHKRGQRMMGVPAMWDTQAGKNYGDRVAARGVAESAQTFGSALLGPAAHLAPRLFGRELYTGYDPKSGRQWMKESPLTARNPFTGNRTSTAGRVLLTPLSVFEQPLSAYAKAREKYPKDFLPRVGSAFLDAFVPGPFPRSVVDSQAEREKKSAERKAKSRAEAQRKAKMKALVK